MWVWSDAWYASAIVVNKAETMIARSANNAAAWTLRLDAKDGR
jgi:hypothetical protein